MSRRHSAEKREVNPDPKFGKIIITKFMEVHLIVPIAMEEKLRFAIREGGRTVGAGVVASIIE